MAEDEESIDRLEEAREFLKKVESEIKRREERMIEIEQTAQSLKMEQTQCEVHRAIRLGDARFLRNVQAKRSSIKQRLSELEKRRKEAAEDIERARERRKEALDELRNLGEA